MHFRCVFTLLLCCVLLGLDWAELIMHLYLHVTCSCIFIHMYLQFFIFWYIFLLVLFLLSLSLPLSLFLSLVTSWHPNANPLCPKILFVLGHLLPLTPLHLTFGSMMRRLVRTSRRTFLDEAFIRSAKSSYRIFSILTYPLSSIVGVRSHCVAPRSLVILWSYRSFTPICTYLILQYLSFLFCLRYAHCGHFRYCIRGAPCPEGSASWLPWLWSSEDCVQRWAYIFVLWDSVFLRWYSEHLLVDLC